MNSRGVPPLARAATIAGLVCVSGVVPSTTAAGREVAHMTRTVYLREYASLHLTKEEGNTLYERGKAWGTFSGGIAARLHFAANSVSATFTLYPKGGSVTGTAFARYIVKGSTGYYGGTLNITKATGSYRHASGRSIGISGTISRYSFKLSVKAKGWIKY